MKSSRVTVMVKPVGAVCNLDCQYCYYLPTREKVFGGQTQRMSFETLEALFAGLLPAFGDDVTIAWQGGEPTLAGIDFFRQAIAFQEKYRRPNQRVSHALQTNGSLLDDDWCRFLNEQQFLVGLSIDGPAKMHDHYRVDKNGEPSSKLVFAGLKRLQQQRVQFNLLCVLNDQNVEQPDAVLDYLLSLGTPWVQFIPAVEWTDGDDPQPRDFSPRGEAYGRFMCRVFDRWFDRLRDKVSVRLFDAVLNQLVLGQTPYCILDGQCHNQLTVEHDGSVFGCDHFVEPRWKLGRIADSAWLDHVDEATLGAFAQRKQKLPATCDACDYRRFCHGGCPKHRPHRGDVAEATVLCDGYKMFFAHALPRLAWLADFLRRGAPVPPAAGKGKNKGKKKRGRTQSLPQYHPV